MVVITDILTHQSWQTKSTTRISKKCNLNLVPPLPPVALAATLEYLPVSNWQSSLYKISGVINSDNTESIQVCRVEDFVAKVKICPRHLLHLESEWSYPLSFTHLSGLLDAFYAWIFWYEAGSQYSQSNTIRTAPKIQVRHISEAITETSCKTWQYWLDICPII